MQNPADFMQDSLILLIILINFFDEVTLSILTDAVDALTIETTLYLNEHKEFYGT